MTVVVTGATGFIGNEVVKEFSRLGERTLALSGPNSTHLTEYRNVEWLPYDCDLEELTRRIAQESPRAVVHCANHYQLRHNPKDVAPMIDANIRMGALLLGALEGGGIHFVNLSTFFQRQGAKGTQPNSLYAATKQAFTEVVRWFGTHSNIRVCDVMLFDTYGPGDRRAKLVPNVLRCAMLGETIEILTPEAEINLCFVEDVAAAIIQIVTQGITGEWSVRAPENCRVTEVVSEIEAVAKRKVVEKFGSGQPHASPLLDGPPVLINWSPVWSLRMGIEACWRSLQTVE